MKEKPTENRIFTGSDDEMSAEQVGNLLSSPEYGIVQQNRIKDLLATTVTPQIAAAKRNRQVMLSIDLIKREKDGELMASVLKCLYVGYTYKKIAKKLMQSERNLPYFSSLGKAIAFVKKLEREGLYRVKMALNKPIIMP